VFHASRRVAAFVAVVAALTTATAACSSSSPGKPAPDSQSPRHTTATTTPSGVTVTGAFGSTPTVKIPDTAAPAKLTEKTLSQGQGAAVAAGDTLVANYVGETWANKKIFDSSFSRGEPAGFVIGKGKVIPGWDKTLVGQKLGSRVLLTIPPVDGYGAGGNSQAGISGTDTLVFVVDLVAAYKPDASAPGTPAGPLPAGWPKISGSPAQEPTVRSVAGVQAPKKPVSALLVKGTGASIDPSKSLVLQLVQTDLATGKDTQSTWGEAPQVVGGSAVLAIASALSGQHLGSRAVVLVPATPASPATGTSPAQPASPAAVLVIDVVGQF
jgi:FKBP-type peptidyl-prolyl cis-trans isomerase